MRPVKTTQPTKATPSITLHLVPAETTLRQRPLVSPSPQASSVKTTSSPDRNPVKTASAAGHGSGNAWEELVAPLPLPGEPMLAPAMPAVILNVSLTPGQTAVLTDLQGLSNGLLASIMQKFSGRVAGYNWTLREDPLPLNINARTSAYDMPHHNITTVFDARKFSGATDLAFARTMLHEAVHAYLRTYFALTPLYARASYPELVAENASAAGPTDINVIHHNEMSRSWVMHLAWALEQYGASRGYKLPTQFYEDLAWGGLETSKEFLKLPQADRERISDIILIEQTGKDSKGNMQSQGGTRLRR